MSLHRNHQHNLYSALERYLGIHHALNWGLEAVWGSQVAAGPVYLCLVKSIGGAGGIPSGQYGTIKVQFDANDAPISTVLVGTQSAVIATAASAMVTAYSALTVIPGKAIRWNDV